MSRKYKFYNKEGLYFVSFATVYWIDVFVQDMYFYTLVESLDYCRKNKGMEIYAWCIMPSHIHLIFSGKKIILEILPRCWCFHQQLTEDEEYNINRIFALMHGIRT